MPVNLPQQLAKYCIVTACVAALALTLPACSHANSLLPSCQDQVKVSFDTLVGAGTYEFRYSGYGRAYAYCTAKIGGPSVVDTTCSTITVRSDRVLDLSFYGRPGPPSIVLRVAKDGVIIGDREIVPVYTDGAIDGTQSDCKSALVYFEDGRSLKE